MTWGGNPFKPILVGDDATTLSPRRSFSQWHQVVEGTADPWSDADLAAARLVGDTVSDVIIQFRSVRILLAEDQLSQVRQQVEQSDQPVIIADAAGNILKLNAAVAALLPDTVTQPRSVAELLPLFPNSDEIERHLEDLVVNRRAWRGEVVVTGTDGAMTPLLVRADPVFTALDRTVGFVLLLTDLTERKAAEASRRGFQESVIKQRPVMSGKLNSRADLLFRNVLSTIVENAQLAALEIADRVDPARMPQMLEALRASVARTAEVLQYLVWHATRRGEGRWRENPDVSNAPDSDVGRLTTVLDGYRAVPDSPKVLQAVSARLAMRLVPGNTRGAATSFAQGSCAMKTGWRSLPPIGDPLMARPVFPFAAIVGQDDMKLAILIAAVDRGIGGVLVFGDRGTGKSTAVRALAALLPPIRVVESCRYGCDPATPGAWCPDCLAAPAKRKSATAAVPVVDLPLGATEDRVLGALDLERALTGTKVFEPGLLARANRGFLYIDEVNLLEDHLVDLLLDVAASGENVVEREGLSIRHPARFVLIGTGNPEEGELRPQLLDRFGLSVEVRTPTDLATRIDVIRRRDSFERDPMAFAETWKKPQDKLRRRIVDARSGLPVRRSLGLRAGTRGTTVHGAWYRRPARGTDADPRRAGGREPRWRYRRWRNAPAPDRADGSRASTAPQSAG